MEDMKLLLVDDNDKMRTIMRTIYSPHFEEVIECKDGNEAVSEFTRVQPDWVVMDIKMNEMDGITATTKIISSYPNARIIIVSQFNDAMTIDSAMNAGAIEFVNKENLYRVIEVINNNKME